MRDKTLGPEERVRALISCLNESGRLGMGSFDWPRFYHKVQVGENLSLLDFCQVSPEGSKELRHLITRVNDKPRKKKFDLETHATDLGKPDARSTRDFCMRTETT